MGVTYYKLEKRYEGDVTKGCGLTSAQVDENFHFLRGYDIKDAKLTEDGKLILERVNCDEIVVDGFTDYIKSVIASSEEGFSLDGTVFNPENGILTIYVNGHPYQVGGFLTNENFRIYVGYGLTGKGTVADPVRVTHVNDTGFFAPVDSVLDYEKGEALPMPEDGGDVSKRYITREQKSPYGLVYTYEAVKDIQTLLDAEGHGWRVPSFEDWVMLLNAQEDCGDEESLNHGNTDEASENGRIAGQKLKDYSWGEETAGTGEFDVLPIKKETFNTLTERDIKTASFWATTVSSADTHVYGKRFIGKRDTVETLGKGQTASNKLSLRLVRDIEWGNESEVEIIGGTPYETVVMETYKTDAQGNEVLGTAVWTKENVTFNDYLTVGEAQKPCGEGFVLADEEAYDNTASWGFYLNDWDEFDKRWVKRKLEPNDVVMIKDYSGKTNEEAVVKLDSNGNQVLAFRSDEMFNKLKPYVDDAVAAEKQERETADSEIWEAIGGLVENLSAETIDRIAEDDALQGEIEALSGKVNSLERTIVDGLQQEKNERISGDTLLQESINSVQGGLTAETQARVNNDVRYGAYTANVGIGEHGLKIKSNDNEKSIDISFNMDMGEITLLQRP